MAATNELSNQMLQISNIVPLFIQHSLYIQNYYDIINYKTEYVNSGKNEKLITYTAKKLELQNVSFSYSGSSTNALNSISLSIEPGEKIAIVGENGAGKTTLIKLIMGLYSPQSGSLIIDDICPTPHSKSTLEMDTRS